MVSCSPNFFLNEMEAQSVDGPLFFRGVHMDITGQPLAPAVISLNQETYICFREFFPLLVEYMFYHLYYFPEAAVTNSQTLRNLKQQKCILSSFWRPEVWNQYQWVEIKVWVGLAGSGGFGENLFLVSSDFWWQLAFLDFYYSSLCLWGTLSSPLLCVWPLAVFSSQDICDCIRSPTLIIQDSLPTSKSLTESHL